jgi:hypothetical protein
MIGLKTVSGASLLLTLVGFNTSASASLITDGALTLDTNPAQIFQQTAATPCVIGGNNCLNGSFPMTIQNGGDGGTLNSNILSPVYNIADITAVVGSGGFTVGIDYNQSSEPQRLDEFSAIFSNGTQTFDVSTVLQVNNNGVGFSDFLLSGFTIPASATTVQFRATWFDNDGPDRYFLIGQNPTPVPEPSTLALIGAGLFGIGLARMRIAVISARS